MGLGAPKRRSKLSHDPNNTTWSNSTDTYGHKILSAQGWKPGDYLGAEQASHSDHYTAANASHIRVLLREDNLGLGAQVGKSNADTFGLSLFSGVLGRLNGKSDVEVERQQGALRDAELRTYQAQKFGMVGFVSGGFLVGDKIRPGVEEEKVENTETFGETPEDKLEPKRKKRKAAQDASEPETKRSKKRRKGGTSGVDEHHVDPSDIQAAKTKQKKAKRSKQTDGDVKASTTTTAEDDRPRQKQEKRARKEERRKRKEERRRLKSERSAPESGSTSPEEQPVVVKTLAPPQDMLSGNRHAVRQRYIQQKRMASMDAQAMKEIFMLKAAA
ncbi:telomerase inhibitor [Vermiconidia calcicola]|uniref:Telomerase inhibitor n=1 Tax=Vermiconidia calcicola TaxID=1690605 RepID=A0ACC3N5R4_9PEZI|nr:telomerase inhibitor [Vermiconidia calcicola]